MSITREIFNRLNESESIKKPYGEKPEEGKKQPIPKNSSKKVPTGKAVNIAKPSKLNKTNPQAADIYANDTDKLMDNIDSKNQSDKGKIAKTNTKKSDKTVKFPFGDKVQQSDSKLIKEGSDVLKEGWYEAQKTVTDSIEKALQEIASSYPDEVEDRQSEFLQGVIGIVRDYADDYGLFLDLNESCKKEEK